MNILQRTELVRKKHNKVSGTWIDGYIGESGISTIFLNIGIDLGDDIHGLMNIDSISITKSTTPLTPTNNNSSIALNQWEFHIIKGDLCPMQALKIKIFMCWGGYYPQFLIKQSTIDILPFV